jgi:2OG-Fe(II) oxygenase superfamily
MFLDTFFKVQLISLFFFLHSYQSHHDYIPTQRRSHEGPRILTLLMYLSNVEDGGSTKFPFVNVTVRPKRGRLLLWPNVLHTQPNMLDIRMFHQALPALRGTKYVANLWIHQRLVRPPSCYLTEDVSSIELNKEGQTVKEEPLSQYGSLN